MPSSRSTKPSTVGMETFLLPACPAERVVVTKNGHGIMLKLFYTKRRRMNGRHTSNQRNLHANIDTSVFRAASGVTTTYANSKRGVFTHDSSRKKGKATLSIMTSPSVIRVPSTERERIAIFKEYPYTVIAGERCLPHIIVDSILAPDTAQKLLCKDTSPVMVDFSLHTNLGTDEKPMIIVVTKDGMVRRAWQYNRDTETCTVQQIVVYSSSQPDNHQSLDPLLTKE